MKKDLSAGFQFRSRRTRSNLKSFSKQKKTDSWSAQCCSGSCHSSLTDRCYHIQDRLNQMIKSVESLSRGRRRLVNSASSSPSPLALSRAPLRFLRLPFRKQLSLIPRNILYCNEPSRSQGQRLFSTRSRGPVLEALLFLSVYYLRIA